jgi:hypothetical protein
VSRNRTPLTKALSFSPRPAVRSSGRMPCPINLLCVHADCRGVSLYARRSPQRCPMDGERRRTPSPSTASSGRIAIRPYTPIRTPYFNRIGLYRHTSSVRARVVDARRESNVFVANVGYITILPLRMATAHLIEAKIALTTKLWPVRQPTKAAMPHLETAVAAAAAWAGATPAIGRTCRGALSREPGRGRRATGLALLVAATAHPSIGCQGSVPGCIDRPSLSFLSRTLNYFTLGDSSTIGRFHRPAQYPFG